MYWLKQTGDSFNTKFGPKWKDWKSSYQVRQFLAIFSNLIALILGWNSVRGLRGTKVFKEIKFEEVWEELESKTGFQRQSFPKYLRLILVSTWNSALREKFNFYCSRNSCYNWQNFHFGRKIAHFGIIQMKFRHFPDVS